MATHALVALLELQVIGIDTVSAADVQSTTPPLIEPDPNDPMTGLANAVVRALEADAVVFGLEPAVVGADDFAADAAPLLTATDEVCFATLEVAAPGAMAAEPAVPRVLK